MRTDDLPLPSADGSPPSKDLASSSVLYIREACAGCWLDHGIPAAVLAGRCLSTQPRFAQPHTSRLQKVQGQVRRKAATQVKTPRLLRKEWRGFCHSGDALRFDAIAPTAAFLLSGPGARFARAHSSGDDAQSREPNGAATSSVVALLTGAQPSPPHKANSAAPAPTKAHRKSCHLVFVIPSHSISPHPLLLVPNRTFCLYLQTP